MKYSSMANGRTLTLVACASILAIAAGGGAVAGSLITSADIKDKTIKKVDLAKNAVVTKKVKDGTLKLKDLDKATQDAIAQGGPQGPAGPPGATGPQGPKGDAGSATYLGPNWSVVDRNVIGSGDAFLRSGPSVGATAGPSSRPPMGIGSLGIRTGSPDDKAAFGNQVDWVGTSLSTISTVSFYIFTTGENIGFARGGTCPAWPSRSTPT